MTTPVIRRRKRPVEVDTIQWTGTNEADVQAFTGGPAVFYALDAEDREGSDDPEATATVFDKLHCTWVLVYTGQHIVRGVKGEHYPIAEDVLAETYESAVAQSAPAETALRDRIAETMARADGWDWAAANFASLSTPATDRYRRCADAVLAVLPAAAPAVSPVGQAAHTTRGAEWRAAVSPRTLHAIAVHLDARSVSILRPESDVYAEWQAVAAELRRMADETQPAEARPHRGDAFEQWLKAQRDEYHQTTSPQWLALDEALDAYRLHGDTGTPLGEHVCEGRVVGDCDCLERPAVGAQQPKEA